MNLLPNPGNNENEGKNLIIAGVVCLLIFLGFEYFKAPQQMPQKQQVSVQQGESLLTPEALPQQAQAALSQIDLNVTQNANAEYPVNAGWMKGQVSSKGGRLHAMVLTQQGINGEEGYQWFMPTGKYLQYVDSGWIGTGVQAPTPSAEWQEVDATNTSKTLQWQNAQGQSFLRKFSFDGEGYTFTITDQVVNNANGPIVLQHYAQVVRGGGHDEGAQSNWMNAFGPLGLDGEEVLHVKYKDLQDQNVKNEGTGFWGISTQYFLTALVVPEAEELTRRFTHNVLNGNDIYTASVQQNPITLAAGQTYTTQTFVYAGPKGGKELSAAGHQLDQVIDYGWFHFMAKPMHDILLWLHGHLGNWGLAIIGLTILLKILTFPLTYKSFVAMARMKKLQPEIKAIQEKYKEVAQEERHQMAMEMMGLYKKHKVNPMSGCWPVLIQMPIFLAMYKMMLISVEFRGADFFLWVTDLSARDPFFVLPVLMGASMWVQMQLNPTAGDPVQQQVMKFLPVIFTVMFLFFPSGLVLYWLTNNVISVTQQWVMLRRAK